MTTDPQLQAMIAQIASDIVDLKRRMRSVESTGQGPWRAVDDGATHYRDTSGNTILVVGRQSDGTYGIQPFDPTPLSTPSAPQLTVSTSSITVTWDGLDNLGTGYADTVFKQLDVHYSTTPGFFPSQSTLHWSWTVHTSPQTQPFAGLSPTAAYYFKFVAVSQSLVHSNPSTEVEGNFVAPPVPSTPILTTPAPAGILVEWDGADSTGGTTWPPDLAQITAYWDTSPGAGTGAAHSFTLSPPGPVTKALSGSDGITTGGTYYFTFKATNTSGKSSALSTEAHITAS